MLRRERFDEAARDGVAVLVPRGTAAQVLAALERILVHPPSAVDLASEIRNKQVKKHHDVLSESLLNADYASSRLDVEAALQAARWMVGQGRAALEPLV